MTNDQRAIRRKVRILDQAQISGDVSRTCRTFGTDRAKGLIAVALAEIDRDLRRFATKIGAGLRSVRHEANLLTVLGVLRVTKALIPHLRANRAGVIVNVSSMGGRIAFPLGALCHGTKFAVDCLSEALNFEMAAIGVRVKIMEPGMVRTDVAGRSLAFSSDERLTEYQPLIERLMATTAAGQDVGSDPLAVAETTVRAARSSSATQPAQMPRPSWPAARRRTTPPFRAAYAPCSGSEPCPLRMEEETRCQLGSIEP